MMMIDDQLHKRSCVHGEALTSLHFVVCDPYLTPFLCQSLYLLMNWLSLLSLTHLHWLIFKSPLAC